MGLFNKLTELSNTISNEKNRSTTQVSSTNQQSSQISSSESTKVAPPVQQAAPPIPSTQTYMVSINGQQYGPYNVAQIQQMIPTGQINAQTLTWCTGMSNWAPASQIPELMNLFAPQVGMQIPPMPPTNNLSSPTNNKYGNVIKCPSCGAQVIGGKAFCPECGYNFSNVAANSSAERLAAQLQQLALIEAQNDMIRLQNSKSSLLGKLTGHDNSDIYGKLMGKKTQSMICIENFPIPNTREDLLEFLTSLQQKAEKPSKFSYPESELGPSYWALYSNCINKARISYKDDPDFQYFFEDYNNR